MCKKMCSRIAAAIFITVALALAITVSVWHQQGLALVVFVSRFFDVMLPVLAVGALIKYLVCGGGCSSSGSCHQEGPSSCKKD